MPWPWTMRSAALAREKRVVDRRLDLGERLVDALADEDDLRRRDDAGGRRRAESRGRRRREDAAGREPGPHGLPGPGTRDEPPPPSSACPSTSTSASPRAASSARSRPVVADGRDADLHRRRRRARPARRGSRPRRRAPSAASRADCVTVMSAPRETARPASQVLAHALELAPRLLAQRLERPVDLLLRLLLQPRPLGGERRRAPSRARRDAPRPRCAAASPRPPPRGRARVSVSRRVERRVRRLPARAEPLLRGREDARRQAGPLGHGERARAPDGARPHAERRAGPPSRRTPSRPRGRRARSCAHSFTAERCVVATVSPPRARSSSRTAIASAAPSSGSVPLPSSSRRTRLLGVASARTRAVRVIAAANDERSPRRSCASPATTRTLVEDGERRARARPGSRSPTARGARRGRRSSSRRSCRPRSGRRGGGARDPSGSSRSSGTASACALLASRRRPPRGAPRGAGRGADGAPPGGRARSETSGKTPATRDENSARA